MQSVDELLSGLLLLDLFDDFEAGIFVTDGLGEVLAVNRSAAEMLGYAQEELLGRNVSAFTHPEDVAHQTPPRPSRTSAGPRVPSTTRPRRT